MDDEVWVPLMCWLIESLCISSSPLYLAWVYLFVEGRGFHVEGEGTMSRVEGNIFFPFFFLEKVIIDAINVIKTNKENLKNKWRVNII